MHIETNENAAAAVVQSAEAMNEILQNAVGKTQDMNRKLIGMATEQKVGVVKQHSGKINILA